MKSFGLFRKRPWEQMSLGGYTAGEIKVLMTLKFHAAMQETDSLKVSEISSRMGVTSPTITQFINGLEVKGLVTRIMDPQDRRAVRVELTEEGQQIADQAHEAFRAHFKGLVQYLGREESAELARLLTKVYIYWTEHEAAPPPPGSEAKGEE
ncbi:MarR family transcriptional regulator [Paenibacillus sp. F411]|nr:MarR family transcriptional regulator [Paenibacillus sp. F411]